MKNEILKNSSSDSLDDDIGNALDLTNDFSQSISGLIRAINDFQTFYGRTDRSRIVGGITPKTLDDIMSVNGKFDSLLGDIKVINEAYLAALKPKKPVP